MLPSVELASSSTHWPRTLRSLRYRNFRHYWSGQIVSQVGTWMQIVAQGWVVYRLTDSPLMLGLVNFAALIPVAPISLLAGVISDRFPRRNLVIMTELVLMGQAIILALLLWLDVIRVWHIIVLSFVLGAAAALEQPARLAMVVDMVGKDDLSNAVALNSSANNVARILGPSIAGLLVGSLGEAPCFLFNGATYLVVVIVLLKIRLPQQPILKANLQVSSSLANGFRYTWDNREIRGLLTIVAVSSFLTLPYMALMPVFARDVLQVGPEGLGFLLTAVGIGAIIGAILVANLKAGHRGKWLIYANILAPAFLLFFSYSTSLVLSLSLVVLVGAGNAIRQILANSMLQIITLEEYQGRVMSIFNLLFNGMSRVGALSIGALAEVTGAAWALGSGALTSLLLGVVIHVRLKDIRNLA